MKNVFPIWFYLEIKLVIITLSFSCFFRLSAQTNYSFAFQNEKAVELALLDEDWQSVYELLGKLPDTVSSIVPYFIKAHAALALNHNNESLCLFVGISLDSTHFFYNLDEWFIWVKGLATRHPGNAMSFYLLGDALARKMQWDSAIMVFNKAIEISTECYLAMNARGVLYANLGRWGDAKSEFERVMSINPRFADCYANRGGINILSKTNYALSLNFDKALEINPNFSLALSGKGCTALLTCRFNEAEALFQQASASSYCNSVVLANLETNHFAMLEALKDSMNALLIEEAEAGTNISAIQRNINDVNRLQRNLGNSESINRGFQNGYKYIPAIAESIYKRNPFPIIKVVTNDLSKAHEAAANYQREARTNINSFQEQNQANLARAIAAKNDKNGGVVFKVQNCQTLLSDIRPTYVFGLFY